MNTFRQFKLLFGPYQTPRFRYGSIVWCELHGQVKITGVTTGRIPWPVGVKDGRRVIVVYKGLLKAIKRESAIAIKHWWGVCDYTVWKWRAALGVGRSNEGTKRLKSENFQEPWAQRTRRKAHAKAQDPDRRAKIAAAKRGIPRPRCSAWSFAGPLDCRLIRNSLTPDRIPRRFAHQVDLFPIR